MSTPTTSTEMTFGSTSNMAPSSSSTYNGDAESSKMADTPLYVSSAVPAVPCSHLEAIADFRPQHTIHALGLTDYIFNVGFMQQSFADVQLTFFTDTLKLHRSASESRCSAQVERGEADVQSFSLGARF